MRGTQIIAGLAMMAIIGAITSYPVNAKAAPQLAVAATGTGLAPQISTGSLAGGRRAIETAKSDKSKADAKVKELNGLMDEGDQEGNPALSGLAGRVYSAAEIISAVKKDGAKKHEGTLVKADGVVLKVISNPDHTLVFVGAPKQTDKSPIFAFRMPPNKHYEEGGRITLEGKFLGVMNIEGAPDDIYLVNGHGFSGAVPTAEPAKPRLPYDGWKFVGSVESEDGATGVFVKEGKTLYAQPGDHLSDDVTIVRMKAGEAVIKDGDSNSVVSPW